MTTPRELVGRLGGHPSAALGLELGDDAGCFRWLLAACLLSGRGPEERALEAFRALAKRGLDRPEALVGERIPLVAQALAEAGQPRPEAAAALLVRVSAGLGQRAGGSLAALLAGAEDLDALGAALVGLTPGLGPGAALRFLRPLRERWPAAQETPLAAPARAAALHLAWIREGEDEEGAPGALQACLAREPDAPPLADCEAALERLGRRSCAAGRPERCALAEACPVR